MKHAEKPYYILNLTIHQTDIDKIYSYAYDPYEAQYLFLIYKRESTGLNRLNDSKAFTEYSNEMDDTYKNIQEYNPNKKRKISIFCDNMIANMLSIKKLNPLVTELLTRSRKLNISLVIFIKIVFCCSKNCLTKFYALFYYENSKQTRSWAYSI